MQVTVRKNNSRISVRIMYGIRLDNTEGESNDEKYIINRTWEIWKTYCNGA